MGLLNARVVILAVASWIGLTIGRAQYGDIPGLQHAETHSRLARRLRLALRDHPHCREPEASIFSPRALSPPHPCLPGPRLRCRSRGLPLFAIYPCAVVLVLRFSSSGVQAEAERWAGGLPRFTSALALRCVWGCRTATALNHCLKEIHSLLSPGALYTRRSCKLAKAGAVASLVSSQALSDAH